MCRSAASTQIQHFNILLYKTLLQSALQLPYTHTQTIKDKTRSDIEVVSNSSAYLHLALYVVKIARKVNSKLQHGIKIRWPFYRHGCFSRCVHKITSFLLLNFTPHQFFCFFCLFCNVSRAFYVHFICHLLRSTLSPFILDFTAVRSMRLHSSEPSAFSVFSIGFEYDHANEKSVDCCQHYETNRCERQAGIM